MVEITRKCDKDLNQLVPRVHIYAEAACSWDTSSSQDDDFNHYRETCTDELDHRRRDCLGYCRILCLVDHHSGYAYIVALKRKTAKETGKVLLHILSCSCIPEILQSDDGSEFSAIFFCYVQEYFKTIHILKGKPCRPNEQGSVERGNADFKKALLKWEQK